MIALRPRNVRARLTIWYLAVFGVILILYIAGTCAFLYFSLLERLDDTLADSIERIEPLIQPGPGDTLRFAANLDEPDPDRQEDQYVEILTADGRALYRSQTLHNRELGGRPYAGEGVSDYSERSMLLPQGARVRLASRIHRVGSRLVLIRLALPEEPVRREVKELLSVLLIGFPLGLALAGFGGYAVARRMLAPLGAMARRAEQLTAENLYERLPVDNPEDELGHLARVFNHTLERLERSFQQLRRFTADASHELRTPLTAIRSVGEVGLQGEGTVSRYRDIIGSMLEEANRLTCLVDSLLRISRADAGQIQLQRTPVPLFDLAEEASGLLEILAEEKGAQLKVKGDRFITVMGDRLILRQAVMNLIDNAIKYSPQGGIISVEVSRKGNEGMVEVSDSGPGIPKPDQDQIFDRFYRVDKARSREAGGTGLGLSITRWAVKAHGGRITVDSEEGRGATFCVALPMAEADKPAAIGLHVKR